MTFNFNLAMYIINRLTLIRIPSRRALEECDADPFSLVLLPGDKHDPTEALGE